MISVFPLAKAEDALIFLGELILFLPASWSSGNAFVSGAGGLTFKTQAGQSVTVLPMARHRCDISSEEAVLPGRNDAEMGPANSLHASANYSEYNKRFDLIYLFFFLLIAV